MRATSLHFHMRNLRKPELGARTDHSWFPSFSSSFIQRIPKVPQKASPGVSFFRLVRVIKAGQGGSGRVADRVFLCLVPPQPVIGGPAEEFEGRSARLRRRAWL